MPSIIYKKSVEGFGIAFIEAAQYGLPSLGGIDGGASDAIINNKTGILCNGNNLNEIYTSIETMLLEKKYIELGNNAKKNAENFQWNKIILEYQKILN
jgi:phosphatidylinositol alpha-1,6-mannosyltransferase